ncbi:hypothetical protein RJ639_006027 [Escallonia herrerae]|uniref:Reverse transcriptase Ty1/copia-type domain-containing protein n=1 Tax=Escallonia herrerae TaxID=1293975 RepID=A0AA88VXW5_9ASTE|nr:hypothetical protein RJ639_006027 [Escallonia herrerae]
MKNIRNSSIALPKTDREEKFDLLRRSEQLDVKTAFLHSELEHIFMRQLEGFVIQEKEDHVCLLKKSLCGLKQSPM